jgi:hypothetical protein
MNVLIGRILSEVSSQNLEMKEIKQPSGFTFDINGHSE